MYPVGYPRYTATDNHCPSVRLSCTTQQNSEALYTCLKNVTPVWAEKNISSHSLILTAIQWTKRRRPRLTTNLNIFVLLWYLAYAKKSKWRSDESGQIKKKVPVFCGILHGNRILASLCTCEQTDPFQEPAIHITCYSPLFQPTIARNTEKRQTSEVSDTGATHSGVLKSCTIFEELWTLFRVYIYEKLKRDKS